MAKYIVLLLMLYSLEGLASPSALYRGSLSDDCGGAVPCAGSTISPPPPNSAIEELSRAMERAVASAISKSIKNFPTTTPAPTPIRLRAEIARLVSITFNRAMKDFTRPSCTNEEIASIVAPYQRTVENLTTIVERLTAPTSPTTMTPLPGCTGEIASAAAYQETVRNLTTIVAQLTAFTTTTLAPAPRCDCDEQVATSQFSVQDLTRTLAEVKQKVASLSCVSGYEYSNVTGQCYKLHKEKVPWPVANSTCHEEGGHLAVVNSLEESHVLSGFRKRTIEVCFIGVFRDAADRWITVTGEDVVEAAGFYVWDGGEPWSGEKWRYGMMFSKGTYATAARDGTGNFICEREA